MQSSHMPDPETCPDDGGDRTVRAFVLAPLASSLAFVPVALLESVAYGRLLTPSAFINLLLGAGVFCVFTYPSGFLVGLPIWLLLRRRIAHAWLLCAAAGTLTAWLTLVILSLLLWPLFLLLPSNLEFTSKLFGVIGYAGAVGGFTVWLVAGTRRSAPTQ